MSYPIIQFVQLENLLAEAAGACVRAIAPVQQILSWHYQVDTFSFYMQGRAGNGHFPNGRSSEQERYETAWQQAEKMKDELVTLLRDDEYTVHTDGIITLNASKRDLFPHARRYL